MPIGAAEGILEVENAKFSASEFIATTSVGIGTTSASAYPLVIFKETEPEIRIQEGDAQSSGARFYSNNSNLYIQTGTDFSSGSSGDIAFQTMGGQSTHVIVKGDGKVGVGTGSPVGKFHVSGAGAVYMTISDTSAGTDAKNWWTSVSGNQMTHYLANDASSASQPYMKINRSGYTVDSITFDYGDVGIGVASPTSKLDVSGYIKSTNPCFSAYSIQGNTSYDPAEPIVLEYTLMNVGSCYSTSTGAFTAPVNGYYQFNTVIFNNTGTYRQFTIVWKQSSSSTSWIIPLGNTFINGGTRTGGGDDYLTSDSDPSTVIGSGSILIKLDAGNQIAMCMRSGTSSVSIYRAHSSFSGFLISPA